MAVSSAQIWTFQDVVNHLVDSLDLDANTRSLRNAKRAVINAYLELPHKHQWRYYERRGTLSTVDMYETGTVTYDHTGGTYERQLTLSGGTWPSWAANGRVIINDVGYAVEDRKDDGVTLTLGANSNPGSDIATATAYSISQAVYELPSNVKRMTRPVELSTGYEIDLVDTPTLLEHTRGNYTPTRPYLASIRGSSDFPSGLAIELAPPPNDARTYDYFYEAKTPQLSVYEYKTGTASISTGSATVNGSGTSWTSDMVGSVIRFSANNEDYPTSIIGAKIDREDVLNPYKYQGIIKSVDNATQLTLTENATETLSSVYYTVSDIIDCEPGAMLTYFLKLCEWHAVSTVKNNRLEIRESGAILRQFFIDAASADSRIKTWTDRESPVQYYDLEDWAIASG